MHKYIVSSCGLLLFVTSNMSMSMQTLKKSFCNTNVCSRFMSCTPISQTHHKVNREVGEYVTVMINNVVNVCAKINQSNNQIKKLEAIILADLRNEALVEEALWREHEIAMYKDLIDINKVLLSKKLPELVLILASCAHE